MKEEILIAGFGGQGVLSMGKILAYSGIMQDKQVTWMPSYGPEMRGGTANVTVIMSDEAISSPIVQEYDTVVALNQQSLSKFEETVKAGGLLLYDPNGIVNHPTRTDITIYSVDAAEVAAKEGKMRFFNMIVLGALMKLKPLVTMDSLKLGLAKSLPERLHKFIPDNEAAMLMGMDLLKKIR